MQRTVTRLFESRAQAEEAVRQLEANGFSTADLTILAAGGGTVAGEDRSFLNRDGDNESDTLEGAGEGALTGGAIGAGVGLLAGITAIAVPGLGTAAATGWLASTLAGAAGGAVIGGGVGGILGALKDAGVTDDDAHVYAEGVKRGQTLVSVRVDEENALRAEAILDSAGGATAATRGQAWRGEGWSGRYDETAGSPAGGTMGMGVR